MNAVAGRTVALGTSEAVHRQTEGNPVFVHEVARYLRDEGLLTDDSVAIVPTVIPEGLRDVVGKRLSRLSPGCNEILRTAAVIGREFRVDVLQQLVDVAEPDFLKVLEEAQARSLVEERSSAGSGLSFRFTHAFFRQTLYEGDLRCPAYPTPPAGWKGDGEGTCPSPGGPRGRDSRPLC